MTSNQTLINMHIISVERPNNTKNRLKRIHGAQSLRLMVVCLLIAFLSPGPASADLIGDDITIATFIHPGGLPAIVGAGTEYNAFSVVITEIVDVSAASFSVTIFNQASFSVPFSSGAGDVFVLSGLDWVDDPINGMISNVQLTTPADSQGLTASNLQFSDAIGLDSGSISFGVDGSLIAFGMATWSFDITAVHGPAIPLPPTVWLLGSALVGLAGMRNRRRAD